MSLTFTGQSGISRELDRISRELERQTERALLVEAEALGESAQEIVPVQTGALRDSKEITTRDVAGGIESVVSFGGPSAPYATLVHERSSTGRKFLETPLMAAERGFLARLGKRLKIG